METVSFKILHFVQNDKLIVLFLFGTPSSFNETISFMRRNDCETSRFQPLDTYRNGIRDFLEDVLYFLEQVFPQASRFVLQYEASVRFHIGQAGQEASVGVFVEMQALAAEEGAGVAAGN